MKSKQEHPFFELTVRERKGTFIILLISISFWFLPRLMDRMNSNKDKEIRYHNLTTAFLLEKEEEKNEFDLERKEDVKKTKRNLTFFDPNKLDEEEWEDLGVRPKTAQTIVRYVNKGGKFRKPEDLRKIWGLDESLCEKLIPYVKISSEIKESNQMPKYGKRDTIYSKKERFNQAPIFINKADSIQWESLPGIGPALAHRIVAYREKLGGFVSVDQLTEVWNLPDSVFQKIKNRLKSDDFYKKMDINSCGKTEFGRHPYFGFRLAKIIVNYREQHGLFQTLEDIQKIALIDKIQFERMRPYITIIKQ
jgi:competence ComEA-like helix-hairpin-helix protein